MGTSRGAALPTVFPPARSKQMTPSLCELKPERILSEPSPVTFLLNSPQGLPRPHQAPQAPHYPFDLISCLFPPSLLQTRQTGLLQVLKQAKPTPTSQPLCKLFPFPTHIPSLSFLSFTTHLKCHLLERPSMATHLSHQLSFLHRHFKCTYSFSIPSPALLEYKLLEKLHLVSFTSVSRDPSNE